ncbi:MAG: Smr/MutS family protein [Xanthobacteraceae bacterium]
MTRRRQLSDEEQALWSGFVRSIKPLHRAKNAAKPPASENSSAPKPVKVPDIRSRPQPAKSPPLAPLGRRLKQRVARGREPIEARIDLHGMTQAQAHTALLVFLEHSQADGARTVLVVTGKGAGASAREGETGRGVLKRQVPMWLSLPEFRAFVLGFEDAHIGHGGEGALYVRVRRSRSP